MPTPKWTTDGITFKLSFRLVEAWLQDLTDAGYQFPDLRQENISSSCQEIDCAVVLWNYLLMTIYQDYNSSAERYCIEYQKEDADVTNEKHVNVWVS